MNEVLVQVGQGWYDDWHVVAMVKIPESELVELKRQLKENQEAQDKTFLELRKFQQLVSLEPHRQPELDTWKTAWSRLHDEAQALRQKVLAYPRVPYQELQLN